MVGRGLPLRFRRHVAAVSRWTVGRPKLIEWWLLDWSERVTMTELFARGRLDEAGRPDVRIIWSRSLNEWQAEVMTCECGTRSVASRFNVSFLRCYRADRHEMLVPPPMKSLTS